jgi:hypothetical protein
MTHFVTGVDRRQTTLLLKNPATVQGPPPIVPVG